MSLKIHFLNVGHGDCTIVEHPSGRLTMIDINNGSDLDDKTVAELEEAAKAEYDKYKLNQDIRSILGQSLPGERTKTLREFALKAYNIELTNPIEYYTSNFSQWTGSKPLFRFVATHPDLDHLTGLQCLKPAGVGIENFWDTDNNKVVTSFKSDAEKAAWASYQSYRAGNEGAKVLNLFRGAEGVYYNQDDQGGGGDGIVVLAPTPALRDSANQQQCWNLHSYVLALKYAGRLIILGGDADLEAWEDIHNLYGENLKCDVLKASHHGRDSGYYQPAVKAMSPEYTIVSVGKKPETDASNKYRQYSDNVLSTRWCGNIVVTISPWGEITVDKEYDRSKQAAFALASILGQPQGVYGR